MLPAFFGGGANGAVLALLIAYLYPGDTLGVILHHPPDIASQKGQDFGKIQYLLLAEAAENGGMEAALKLSEDPPQVRRRVFATWLSKLAASSPAIREQILSFDPALFSATMRRWNVFLSSPRFHLASLSKDQLQGISAPVIVGRGYDEAHPESTAQAVLEGVPRGSFVDLTTMWSRQEIKTHLQGNGSPSTELSLNLPFYESFVKANTAPK
jgi:pimeloyl-ACP methyl ester carboxylesterase